jgi:uncharacterized heparinase superfamily protein
LSERRSIRQSHIWNDPSIGKLWLYNLHYFDDLLASSALRRDEHRAFMDRWISENPPANGNGWEPYPTSLRIVNWIKWSLEGGDIHNAAWQSLAVQTRWLAQRIEHHLQANHLFVNAKALVFAGLAASGGEARAWLEQGCRLLGKQMSEQILTDGGHFERSPMYHALILEDILDLLNAFNAWSDRASQSDVIRLRQVIPPMLDWLRAMSHPDGHPSLFNDCAFGIAPTLRDLLDYAGRLGVGQRCASRPALVDLADSGYFSAALEKAFLVVDAAPIGPDIQPGHAHADTLSFELSVGEERIVVNGGTSTYTVGQQRILERSTRSHSTLQLGEVDSSEVWGGFRVARRARITSRSSECRPDGMVVISASHDGYRRVQRSAVHARSWILSRGVLSVRDTMPQKGAVSRFLLHPALVQFHGTSFRTTSGVGIEFEVCGGTMCVVPSEYRPRFGQRIGTLCVEARPTESVMTVMIRWH